MKTKKILTLVAVATLLGVSLLYAQGDAAPRLDPEAAVTLEGAVVSLTKEPGKPATLVVDDAELGRTVVRLGPGWYLDGLGFTAAAGESVKVAAQPCIGCAAAFAAVRVENLATGSIAELRDGDGRPVWRGSGKGKGQAAKAMGGGGCGRGRGYGKGGGNGRGQGCGGQGCCRGCGGGQRAGR